MMNPDINSIAIITVKGDDYHCMIYGVRKYDANHVLENSVRDDHGFI